MKTEISLTYCGMSGHGRTVKDAKQDAARKIESFLSQNHEPKIIVWAGTTFLAWYTPEGIVSGYVHSSGTRMSGTCHHCHTTDMERVLQDARMNLAKGSCDIESDEIPALIRGDVCNVNDFVRWLGWQRAYRHANKNQGLNDVDSHKWACDNAINFQPLNLLAA